MGEENKSGTDESTEDQSDDTGQEDEGSAEDNTDDNSDDGNDDSGDDDDAGDDGEENDDDDEEPAFRKKTNADFIIERQKDKIKALKNKKKNGDDDSSEDDEEDDDDVSKEDEAVVDKIIRKNYGDKFAKLDESEDKAEMKDFLAENPDFKSLEKKIWKFWQHPSRNHLPIKSVAYEVAGPALLRMGAKRGIQADDKAKKSSSGGDNSRNAGGKVDYDKMSDADFQKHVEKVKRGK